MSKMVIRSLRLIVSLCLIATMLNRDLSFGMQQRSLAIDDETRLIRKQLRHLRIATFGASRTWGAGLGVMDRYKAYPYLLSRNVTNLAIRASGPDYPALCTFSMVGETEIYDAIVLEYYLDSRQKLLRLAHRLRSHFPDATLIFLRIWGPLQYTFKPKQVLGGLRWWMQQRNLTDIHNPIYHEALTRQSNASEWEFWAGPVDYQMEAVHAVNGTLWEMPRPDDPIVALRNKAYLYSEDMVHLSVDGHKEVARGIRDILLARNNARSNRVQPWDSRDYCESWYERPNTNISKLNFRLQKFATDPSGEKLSNGKWALECEPEAGACLLDVSNNSSLPAEVFLRFMAMGPPTINKYPNVKVTLQHAMNGIGPTYISPQVNDYTHRVHLNRVRTLGVIPPGVTSRITVERLGEPTEWPFRVTGVVVTPTDQPHQISKIMEHTQVSSEAAAATAQQ